MLLLKRRRQRVYDLFGLVGLSINICCRLNRKSFRLMINWLYWEDNTPSENHFLPHRFRGFFIVAHHFRE